MRLGLIVAYAENGVMGRGNELPWKLPADLAHFKKETLGKPIIMGRKTWESIGRPLPGRRNVVLSRRSPTLPKGVECYESLDQAVRALEAEDEVMVIGGASIYQQALEKGVDELVLTKVLASVEGDVFFPKWDPLQWVLVEEDFRAADERNPFDLKFCRYRPK